MLTSFVYTNNNNNNKKDEEVKKKQKKLVTRRLNERLKEACEIGDGTGGI